MTREEILQVISKVFADTLDEDNIVLSESSKADDVEGWDSLTHVQLVVAVEKQFKIRFTAKEIQSWKNVGELIDSINSKL
ncbi:MAG TPA: acyl carrier protein [Ferruginibacter sp.]|nr:acyl carrier protein [Ferruginibacter sp.]HPH91772.1 acyl carrier protein [Ferruginibacter sp.]